MDLKQTIRAIPDYPKPGIMFRDVTTLMGDPTAFAASITQLQAALAGYDVDKVAGIEARGFVFGAALAAAMGCGFVPVRKKGKLPGATRSRAYALEYGEDCLEIHDDAVMADERVVLVDDLLATGGTAEAAADLLAEAGARVDAIAFVVDLPELGGKTRLLARGVDVITLVEFEGH